MSETKIKLVRAIFRTLGDFIVKKCDFSFWTPCLKYFAHNLDISSKFSVRQEKRGVKHLSVTKIKLFIAIFRILGGFIVKSVFF